MAPSPRPSQDRHTRFRTQVRCPLLQGHDTLLEHKREAENPPYAPPCGHVWRGMHQVREREIERKRERDGDSIPRYQISSFPILSYLIPSSPIVSIRFQLLLLLLLSILSLPLPSCYPSPPIHSDLRHLPSPQPLHRSLSSLAAESDETSELVSTNIYAPFMKSVQRLPCGLSVNISSYYYQPLCFWREMYVFVRHCAHPIYFSGDL
jgi:hypothetical protein